MADSINSSDVARKALDQLVADARNMFVNLAVASLDLDIEIRVSLRTSVWYALRQHMTLENNWLDVPDSYFNAYEHTALGFRLVVQRKDV